MKTFACVNSGIVTNAIAADDGTDIEVLEILMPNEEAIIKVTDETGIAFIGHKYFADLKKFQPYQSFASWSWNDDLFKWEAPTPYPNDGFDYYWDEEQGDWLELTIQTEKE